MIEILSEVGNIDWNEKRKGVPHIITALRNGRVDLVCTLLAVKGVDPNIKDYKGESLATIGVNMKNVEFLRQLSEAPRLNWNTFNNAGDCPVILAVRQDLLDVFKFLKSLPDLDLTVRDAQGRSLEDIALSGDNTEILKELVSVDEMTRDNLVLSCVLAGNLDVLKSVRLKREEWNMKDAGDTPIIRAMKLEKVEAVKLLLAVEDTDVNELDRFGQSLGELAVIKNCEEVVRIMLNDDRVNWNLINSDGDSPLLIGLSFKVNPSNSLSLITQH